MNFTFLAPRKYVQGRNVLREAGTHFSRVGRKPLVLWGPRVKALLGERVLSSLKDAALETVDVEFQGDSTKTEAARIARIAREHGADMIAGLGGGKVLDTAKASAALVSASRSSSLETIVFAPPAKAHARNGSSSGSRLRFLPTGAGS